MAVKTKKTQLTEAAVICRRVRSIAGPAAAAAAAEVAGVEFLPEGTQWILRVTIDKEGGVDLDDCAQVSRALSAALDREDLIKQAFVLEVSSPGVERPLKEEEDFRRYNGRMISVYTREPYEGYTMFSGILTAYGAEGVTLVYGEERIAIPLALIENARLIYMGQENANNEEE
ncbi:MAG: ribosome maturation factor RimP [Gracilibacteraceae bacterium]|jgi:ribosome maturation factor RimP|nr:ribosome maturation factor RimP [Gracilibacteraceae bacterium]